MTGRAKWAALAASYQVRTGSIEQLAPSGGPLAAYIFGMGTLDYIRKIGPFTGRGREVPGTQRLEFCLLVNAGMQAGLSVRKAVAELVDLSQMIPGAKLDRLDRHQAIETGYRNYYRWARDISVESDHELHLRTTFAREDLVETRMPKVRRVRLRDRIDNGMQAAPILARGRRRGRPRKNTA